MKNIFQEINMNENILYLGYNKTTLANIKTNFLLKNIIIKSTDKLIKNIIIDSGFKSFNNLDKIVFNKEIKMFVCKSNNIIYRHENYFKNVLGYDIKQTINHESNYKYILLSRPITTILYIADIDNIYIEKIKNHIKHYCISKGYKFRCYINKTYSNTLDRLELVKKELSNTEHLLVLFKYSIILNKKTTLKKIIELYNLNTNTLISFDKHITKRMDNFYIKNAAETIDILNELIINIKKHTANIYITNNEHIRETSVCIFNNYKSLISYNGPNEYIICIDDTKLTTIDKPHNPICVTSILPSQALSINFKTIFNYYIYLSSHFGDLITYNSLYDKRYSWGNTKGYIYGYLEFSYKNRLKNICEDGTYRKITKHSYKIFVSNYELMIFFDYELKSFKGYDLHTLEEVIGFEIME
tara:strand:- start:1903 stop:3144 length:1242 start_codon:yes stop_codon:yes gene_type:complete